MPFDKYRRKGAYHYRWYNTEESYRRCVDRCLEFCKGTTLDVGCGDGLVCKLLTEKGLEVTGIDNEAEGIRLAMLHAPGAQFLLQDVSQELHGRYEYMVCLNVIEHLDNPERIVGIFDANITKAAIIITDRPQQKLSRHHVKEFSPDELAQLFQTRRVVLFGIDENFHGIEVYK